MAELPLLDIRGLHVAFETARGRVHALNGVDLALPRGTITGLVGETGSGKSATARAVLRLLDANAVVTAGQILFAGRDLLAASERDLRSIRGGQIAMVFQDARSALNPVFSVGHQIERVMVVHEGLVPRRARARAVEMLTRVGIADAERRAKQAPHQLSGGMCQRVMIAMALICSPRLIILDEPTTGLDVTVQAEILELVQQLVADAGRAALLITHDLGVVAHVCQRVAVMYAGKVVEHGDVEAVFARPLHPYTADLCRTRLDVADPPGPASIRSISGAVPDLRRLPPGCAYGPRCAMKTAACDSPPPLREPEAGHTTRCFHAERLMASPA
jgi:oligopeptide/dipeptide ABC transporter ATP-binding protein